MKRFAISPIAAVLAAALLGWACSSSSDDSSGPGLGPVGHITGATFDDTGDILRIDGEFASNENGADLRVFLQGQGGVATQLQMLTYSPGGVTVALARQGPGTSGDLWVTSNLSSLTPSDTVQVTEWYQQFYVTNFDVPSAPDTGKCYRAGQWTMHMRGVLNRRLQLKTIHVVRDGVVVLTAGGQIYHAPDGTNPLGVLEGCDFVGEPIVKWGPFSDVDEYQDVLVTAPASGAGEVVNSGAISFRAFKPLAMLRVTTPPGVGFLYRFDLKADNVPFRLQAENDYAIIGDEVIRVNLREAITWETISPIFPPRD